MEAFLKRTISTLLIASIPLWPGVAGGEERVRPLGEKIRSGRFLFEARGCSGCHTVMGKGGTVGPDLTRATVWASPLLGAAVMWNHVPLMEKAMRERSLIWPAFQAEDVADIFTYLHSLNREEGAVYPFRGEARLGEVLFAATCQKCHGPPFKGGGLGPDLGPKIGEMVSESAFATRMLRHAPTMIALAQEIQFIWPRLTGNKMADIFVYLKSLRSDNR